MSRFAAAVLLALSAPLAARGAAVPFDFDGDRKADLASYDRPTGTWTVVRSTGGLTRYSWGWSEAIPVAGDFDHDGRADLAVYQRSAGNWFIAPSGGGSPVSVNFGWSGATPVPGDYDGDGITDLAVYDQGGGVWYLALSSGASQRVNWGWADARPVPADYDGDGRTDIAVYHPATGNWYIKFATGASTVIRHGGPAAIPVPADYDGDGIADVAVYTPQTGEWWLRLSSGSEPVYLWGWSEAQAVPADYDGDGKADLAVYHAAQGTWYIVESATGDQRVVTPGGAPGRACAAYRHGARDGLVMDAFGDSVTDGEGSSSPPATAYPTLLDHTIEASYGGDFDTVVSGLPGENTTHGAGRLPGVLDQVRPQILLLMEGNNDCYSKVPAATIEANLRNMVATAQARGVFVVLATIAPVISVPGHDRTDQASRITSFNPRIYAIASSYGIPVARVYESITAVSGWQTRLMDQSGGNHPNDAGYAVVRDAFQAALAGALNAGRVY